VWKREDNIMTDKWKYKSVSLKESTYSELNDLQKTLVPGLHLSNAKVVEKLIKDKKSECSCSGDIKENTNGKEKAQRA
jgi:translation initiation factor 1 (eIF-1/SUI1)